MFIHPLPSNKAIRQTEANYELDEDAAQAILHVGTPLMQPAAKNPAQLQTAMAAMMAQAIPGEDSARPVINFYFGVNN